MVPITMLAVMCALPFFLSPDEPEKLMVSITLLLSFTVLTDFINRKLPETSDNISTIVWYMTSLFVQAFLGVICNACVLILHKWDSERGERVFSRSRSASLPGEVAVATICQLPAHSRVDSVNLSDDASGTVDLSDAGKSSRAHKLNFCLIVINTTVLLALSLIAWLQMLL